MSTSSLNSQPSSNLIFCEHCSDRTIKVHPFKKRPNQEKVNNYFFEVIKSDLGLWKNSEKIALLAKRLENRVPFKTLPATAEDLLALAYFATHKKDQSATKSLSAIAYKTCAKLSSIERGRLIKVLHLLSGADGKLLRAYLFPMLYQDAEQTDGGLSVSELLEKALTDIAALKTMEFSRRSDLKLPGLLKTMSNEEHLTILNAWESSVKTRLELLKYGNEILLTHYYAIYLEGQNILSTVGTKLKTQLGFSRIVDGLNAEAVTICPNSKCLQKCTACAQSVILLMNGTLTPLASSSACNYSSFKITNLAVNEAAAQVIEEVEKRLKTRKSALLTDQNVSDLETLFLTTFDHQLWPMHWFAPEKLAKIQKFPSEEILHGATSTKASGPKINSPTNPIEQSIVEKAGNLGRWIDPKIRHSFERSLDLFLRPEKELWVPNNLYKPEEIARLLFNDLPDNLFIVEDLAAFFEKPSNSHSENPMRAFGLIHSALLLWDKGLINKEKRVTHREVIYFFHLQFQLKMMNYKYSNETLIPLISSLYPLMIKSLSLTEKCQLVRFANLLHYPFGDNAHKFRNDILPALYTLGEASSETPWLSNQERLKIAIEKIDQILCRPTEWQTIQPSLGKFHLLEPNDSATKLAEEFKTIHRLLDNWQEQLKNGEEIHLPKYFFHSTQSFSETLLSTPHLGSRKDSFALSLLPKSSLDCLTYPFFIEWVKKDYAEIRQEDQERLLKTSLLPISQCNEEEQSVGPLFGLIAVSKEQKSEQQQIAEKVNPSLGVLSRKELQVLAALLNEQPHLLPIHLAPFKPIDKRKTSSETSKESKRLRT